MISPQHQRRAGLLNRLPKNGVGVEVGVWKGDFSAELLKVTHPRCLHLVDPWASRPELTEEWYSISQEEMDAVYWSVVSRFENDSRVRIYREHSPEAAQVFADGSLDWVYLDGDHTYEGITADLNAWWPKVKPGGLLTGDDCELGHWWGDAVVRAVDEFGGTVEMYRDQFVIPK